MHIAICDDNIADRKQTERLMGREADKWIAGGDAMYVDSFGNPDSMLTTPMQFDGFMIDICHTVGLSALTIYHMLREKGVTAPIILCSSEIDYRSQDFPEDALYLDKPLQPEKIHEVMLKVKEFKDSRVPQIELRGEKDTVYVAEEEILYAEQSGFYTSVAFEDGHSMTIRETAISLFEEINNEHPSFVMTNARTIINIRYITKIGFSSVIMKDGKKFSISRYAKTYAKTVKQYLDEGNTAALDALKGL